MALNENPTLEEIVNEVERLNNLIVNRGGTQTITPKTTNQVLSKGYYKGDITVKGDANLIASNILRGKSIFGVSGSIDIGKKWASGVISNDPSLNKSYTYHNRSDYASGIKYFVLNKQQFDFTPSVIIAYSKDYLFAKSNEMMPLTIYINDVVTVYGHGGSLNVTNSAILFSNASVLVNNEYYIPLRPVLNNASHNWNWIAFG